MMEERAAASREATGSGSAFGSGTASGSTTSTPHFHAETSPVQTGTPPSVHAEQPPPSHVPAEPAEPAAADGVFPGPVHP
ncbi:unnamed protein product [Cochlearia groenlandica]